MKKSALIALFGAAAFAAYGQGQIDFGNYYTSHQTTGVVYGNGPAATLGAGPEISVELLYGVSTDTLISQLSSLAISIGSVGYNGITGPTAFNTSGYNNAYSGGGVFALGNVTVPTIGSTGPGSTYAFAIYAFGIYAGHEYTGFSSIFTGPTQATSHDSAPNLPAGLLSANIPITATFAPVPEPSSLALAGLGGFGMLMAFRRKKA